MTGCPFGGRSSITGEGPISPRRALQEANQAEAAAIGPKQLLRLPSGRARIRLLYEEYVHLDLLRSVWERPATERPVLEPLFAAGFHGIELALILLAQFVSDGRRYVAKRPRVELVAEDIATQCQLLTDVVDAELEEELQGGCQASRLSLTQPFPFEGCPPTKAEPCHSPGLQRLTDAITANLGAMSEAERNSLVKLVLNITAAFASFQRWTVGLGIEGQLNGLRAAVGLPPVPVCHVLNLDYDALCQPWRCEQTLICEKYTHAEDFFFRTIHLGTDCWAFVALSRMESARAAAQAGDWHAAAARATQASRILDYLGSHVMLLTSMNLRDYLHLKVELEGTSGEGSALVKSFRPAVRSLLQPLAAALLGCDGAAAAEAADAACRAASQQQRGSASDSDCEEEEGAEGEEVAGPAQDLHTRLMAIYEFPDKQPGLYNYCKALEGLESGLLGGFYYRHYCLAANVIGSAARGTMKRAVAALKAGYETPVFPLLDRCRVMLGVRIDAEVAHNKGRMMDEILRRCSFKQGGAAGEPAPPTPPRAPGGACPVGRASASPPGTTPNAEDGFEVARRRLYSWEGVPHAFRQEVTAELARQAAQLGLVPAPGAACPLAFLDHAWGQLAPLAQFRAWREAAALFQLGNPAWDAAFGRVLPQAATHVRTLLGLPAGADAANTPAVHFGGNSHELVARLLSSFLEARRGGDDGGGMLCTLRPLRLLTTDTEFYSFTRQLNRFVEAGLASVDVVPAEPTDTFAERCAAAVARAAAAGRQYTAVYVSQVTYLSQRCLLPSIPDFVSRVRAAAADPKTGEAAAAPAAAGTAGSTPAAPLVIIDGYHSFCALPTRLGAAGQSCCYVGGLLKHAGCGANCAFLVTPPHLAPRPVITGWLADPSVLASGSSGIQVGSEVGFLPELALQGGTPSYLLPLLTFNHLMQLWQEAGPQPVNVEGLHAHVVRLQERFLERLDAAGHPAISTRTLLPPQDTACRSHTLVFAQPDAPAAKDVVDGLASKGVAVDCRKAFVRFGFGANHSAADVDALLEALIALASASARKV